MYNSDYELDLITVEGEEIQEILTTLNRAQVSFEALNKLKSLPKGDIRIHNLTMGCIREDLGCQEEYDPKSGLDGRMSGWDLIKVLWAKVLKRVSKIINFLKRLIGGGNEVYYDNNATTNQLEVTAMYDYIRKMNASDEVKGELHSELTILLSGGNRVFEGYYIDRAQIAMKVDAGLVFKYLVGEGEGQEITLHSLRTDFTISKGNVDVFVGNSSFGGAMWDNKTMFNNIAITYSLLWRGGEFLKYFKDNSSDISKKLNGNVDLNRVLSGMLSTVTNEVVEVAKIAKYTKDLTKQLEVIEAKIKGAETAAATVAGRKK